MPSVLIGKHILRYRCCVDVFPAISIKLLIIPILIDLTINGVVIVLIVGSAIVENAVSYVAKYGCENRL